jgi:hypothetical protein
VQQHRHQRARAADDDRPVLERDEVVDTVFSFVGAGDYYFVAGVCRNWRGRFMTLCTRATQEKRHRFDTFFGNAFMSASRLQLVLDDGVTIAQLEQCKVKLADAVAKSSAEPMKVITLARLYGMQWNESLTRQSAYHKKYELLKWLIQCGCPWKINKLVHDVLHCDELDHLTRVRAATGSWPVEKLTSLRNFAAGYDALDTVKWCHEQGAAWPKSFYDTEVPSYGDCWSLRCVQWAVASGSAWRTWQCQDLTPGNYSCESDGGEHSDDTCWRACVRKHAVELFKWAHENGCPCTCDETAAAAAV